MTFCSVTHCLWETVCSRGLTWSQCWWMSTYDHLVSGGPFCFWPWLWRKLWQIHNCLFEGTDEERWPRKLHLNDVNTFIWSQYGRARPIKNVNFSLLPIVAWKCQSCVWSRDAAWSADCCDAPVIICMVDRMSQSFCVNLLWLKVDNNYWWSGG